MKGKHTSIIPSSEGKGRGKKETPGQEENKQIKPLITTQAPHKDTVFSNKNRVL
jgi:hypothetical protein